MKHNNASNNTIKATLNTHSQKKSKKIIRPKCSKLELAYADTKNNILHKLGQGTYGLTFRGCYNTVCSIKQGIKLSSVTTRYPDDKYHPTNLEINIGKELSTFVQKGYTPNINMIMESTRCNLEELRKLKSIKGTNWLKENIELRDQSHIHSYINIYFMEIGTMDLKKFIKMRCEDKTIKFPEMLEIMFQVFHTLSVIQYKIPEYRHNDLKPNNLLVKINGDNLRRDFNKFTLVDSFQNGSKKFFIPHRGYTVKIIDFDFNNAKKYPNRKLRGYKNTNFRYLGYSPAVNPVFDVHFILNFFYASSDIMSAIPEFKEFIKNVLPNDCIGSQNKYVEQHKLTSYYVNKETNYIPKDLLTPTELIHFTKYFDTFLSKPLETTIRKEYTTPFKVVSTKMRQRSDMFNVFLRKYSQ
jgi:serine/threonine protein kinase